MTSENKCETWAFVKSCLHCARLGNVPVWSEWLDLFDASASIM